MRHRPIDLQVLHLFVTTAEERNMSAAALRLGTTQSAVSQGIRQLDRPMTHGASLLQEHGPGHARPRGNG